MPVALAGLLLGGLAAIGITGTAATIAAAGITLAIGVGLSLLVTFLFQPKQPKPSDGQTIIKQSAAPRRRSYGRVKVGGVLMFANTQQGFLHRVIAMGSGEIDAVEEHWIDDFHISIDGSGDTTDSEYTRNGIPRVRIEYRLGTDTPALYSTLNAAFPTLWTADHLGKGVPSAYVRLRQVNAQKMMEFFPNLANTLYRQVQRAAKVPDISGSPLALTAPSWSDNTARVAMDYLTHPDGLGLDTSWVENEIESWAQAIADCDDAIPLKAGGSPGTEPRYRTWTTYRFDERPADVLARILQSGDAQIYPTPRRGLAIRMGKWEAPTVTIDDDVIIAFSEIGRGRDALTTANMVRAQFTSPELDYQETDAQPWTDDADIAERGEYATDIELYPVPSHAQCRRLMKVAAHRANPAWVGTLTCNLRALPVMGERFITVQIAELGINDTFEVLSAQMIIEEGNVLTGIQIDVQSLSAAAYEWDAVNEEGTGPGEPPELVPENDLPVPTGFDVTLSGTTATLSWDTPPEDFFAVEARFKATADSAWLPIPVAEGEDETAIGPLDDGVEYEFQIRHISLTTSRVSDWTVSIERTVTADPTAPDPVTGFSATPGGSPTAVTLEWTAPNSSNFTHARVYRALRAADQIVNGGFAADTDWTKGTGWTIAAGLATKSAGTLSDLSQAHTLSAGRSYDSEFEVVRWVAGSVRVAFTGGTLVLGTAHTTTGVKTETITAVAGSAAVAMRGNAFFDGDVDNVKLRRIPIFAEATLVASIFGAPLAAQSYIDTSLAAEDYWYWVVAANGSGVESTDVASGRLTVA